MARKRRLNMTVRVVSPGTLRPNLHNRHAELTPLQRREKMLRRLAQALAALHRRQPLLETQGGNPIPMSPGLD
jgi:hypothetical protein